MDNNQLKIISLTLLILVIVFSAGTTWKIMEENNTSNNLKEIGSDAVTTGRVSIDIQKIRSPENGKVKIEIIPQGDTL